MFISDMINFKGQVKPLRLPGFTLREAPKEVQEKSNSTMPLSEYPSSNCVMKLAQKPALEEQVTSAIERLYTKGDITEDSLEEYYEDLREGLFLNVTRLEEIDTINCRLHKLKSVRR